MAKSNANVQDAVEQIAQTAEEFGTKTAETITERLAVPPAQPEQERQQLHESIRALVQSQKAFFATGATKSPEWRIEQLKKLAAAVRERETQIAAALNADLAKSPFEAYATEQCLVLAELKTHIRHLKKWSKPKAVLPSLATFPARPRIYPEPHGTVLIISPWNYPFLLTLQPLISALAAGNTAVLKTSEYSTETAAVIADLIAATFPPEYVSVLNGGHLTNQFLLREHFDFIFFTGSPTVGRIVMESAAKFLTPVCLELGGKSPCIIDQSANIPLAARRLVWGKLLNAGQTCVAPDYVLVHESVQQPLLAAIHAEVQRQFGDDPLTNPEFPKIINKKHFNRLISLAPEAANSVESNKIAPTVMELGSLAEEKPARHPVMQEEIFGPLLPVISFSSIDDAIAFVNSRPSPLALYLFSTDKAAQQKVIGSVRYGGGCINDVVTHLATGGLPFGGCGESGMGQYHGKYGFDTFSRYKGVLVQSAKLDIPIRYAPYKNKLNFIKKLLK